MDRSGREKERRYSYEFLGTYRTSLVILSTFGGHLKVFTYVFKATVLRDLYPVFHQSAPSGSIRALPLSIFSDFS